MSDSTTIEWCDTTWNPVSGCSKVSEGCRFCYAERLFPRPYPGRAFTDVRFHPERLVQPSKWRRPRRVFVNSMSDLFHEAVTDLQIHQVFSAMRGSPQHTFQVLTKRPARMRDLMQSVSRALESAPPEWLPRSDVWPLPNVWLGVSVENQQTADERIPLLLETPAALRFLSVEPLLAPVDLWSAVTPRAAVDDGVTPMAGTPRVDWVIVGGESGPKARPCDTHWIRDILADCIACDVAAFIKQLGSDPRAFSRPFPLTDRKGGNPDEWPEDLRVREFPLAV